MGEPQSRSDQTSVTRLHGPVTPLALQFFTILPFSLLRDRNSSPPHPLPGQTLGLETAHHAPTSGPGRVGSEHDHHFIGALL